MLLPVFRAEEYLDEALESLRRQTFAAFEIVASDDCSPDGSLGKLEAWARRDSRLRVFANGTRRGVTGNWNECLRRATGRFVVKLDADDAFRPLTLEKLVSAMGEPGVLGAGVRALACDARLQVLGGYPSDDALRRAGLDPFVDHLLPCSRWYALATEGVQLWNGDAFMVRRALFEELGGLDERFGCPSDTEVLMRILEREGSFRHLGYPGVLYRKYGGSTVDVARKAEDLHFEGTLIVLASLSRTAERRQLTRREARQFVRSWKRWKEYERRPAAARSMPAHRFDALKALAGALLRPGLMDRTVVGLRDALSALQG